ncbi:hypothetical protein S010_005185 [Salmonella enterica subsp. enterica serovar Oranienburg]|nr:hypothetical protein [Salmonella enterica subsp. enterica serovar Oranienburg]EED3979964.1 hypothetical protein [Salmonella enterica subsp. enterica serovar Mbandaka]EEJ6498045.1 hypothetical protein [Salmonella enterica subsp. enterica]EEM3506092.1 hypothetical protein [Salmonella enterica]EDV5330262.1 hypothetical protein [Salmonella enterica subsp. enterica serovar Oranienburg]
MKKQGCFYPGIYGVAGGAVHIYRVVKKGLVTTGTVKGQINLILVTLQ